MPGCALMLIGAVLFFGGMFLLPLGTSNGQLAFACVVAPIALLLLFFGNKTRLHFLEERRHQEMLSAIATAKPADNATDRPAKAKKR